MHTRLVLALAAAMLASSATAAIRPGDRAIAMVPGEATKSRGDQVLHPVRIDRAAIEASRASGRLLLPSTGAAPIQARTASVRRRDDGLLVWVGKVDTDAGEQSVVLTVGDGVAFGLIPQQRGEPLRIETSEGRTWLVEGAPSLARLALESDDFLLPPIDASKAGRDLRKRQENLVAAVPPQVDVLVMYTPTLVTVWGSNDAVQARIAYLESISNQAYIDSQTDISIRVVAAHLIDYTLNNDNDDALDALTTGPGSLPLRSEALRWRTMYGADLIALLRNFDRAAQSSCGVGWLGGYHGNPWTLNYAYSVSSDHGFGGDNCGEWTFTHELGHNMGGHHDTETSSGDYGAYTYSRGFRRTITPSSGFATIMAYNQSPQVRIGRLSNPRIATCLTEACGDAVTADNARGFTEAGPAIEAMTAAIVPGPERTLTVEDVDVVEGNSGTRPARFTLRLSAAAAATVTVNLATMHGSAVGADYIPATATVTIPAGQTAVTYDVQVRGDTVVEQDEVFALNVTGITGARVVDGQGIATVTNDEPIPDISIADVSVDEGDSGTRQAVFTVSLSQASNTPVTFDVRSFSYAAGPNAATEGVDFDHVSFDDLRIEAGQTTAQFVVPVKGDVDVENSEAFYVIISGITAANATDDFAVGRIRNDDGVSGRPNLSIGNASVQEGNAGTSLATFTISLSAPSASAVVFGVATGDGTAIAGQDYVARVQNDVQIAAGQTSASFAVTINGDVTGEQDETFSVDVYNVTGAAVTDGEALGTIVNDDAGAVEPALFTRDDRVVLRENGGAATINALANDVFTASRLAGGSFTVTASPSLGTITVQNNGTAGNAADDTLRYTPNPNLSGDDALNYRVCESGGRCVDGVVRVVLRPSLDVAVETANGAGRMDLPVTGLRALPSAVFSSTGLHEAQVLELALAVDATPETPWDSGRAGTAAIFSTLQTDGTNPIRVLADARSLAGGDVDLYLGIDLNKDGQVEPGEVRCVAAMSSGVERCEMSVSGPAAAVAYWVLMHTRSGAAQTAKAEIFVVPLLQEDNGRATLVGSGPGVLAAGESFPLRLSWYDWLQSLARPRLGFIGVRSAPAQPAQWFPVRVDRTGADHPARPLATGIQFSVLSPNSANERLYIDVPAGATRLSVSAAVTVAPPSVVNKVDLYLAKATDVTSPAIAAAPPRNQAIASALGQVRPALTVSGAQLTPGRWYVTPVNPSTATIGVNVEMQLTATVPAIQRGSYFNPARSGHGLFLYPAGGDLAGLWYTYLQDGTATWYYLQGQAPLGDDAFIAGLYRAAWNGTSNRLVQVGDAVLQPTGQGQFMLNYFLDGESGSEPMTALGQGCPQLAGAPLDVSSHWFNPAKAGTGYSVQMFPNYEFYAAFVYDGRGVPRFLTAERNGFGGADATLQLDQLTGFCPLCTRTGNPTRLDVGSLRRRFASGSFAGIELDAIYGAGVTGAWTANEAIQVLGGPGTTQGCVVP